MSTKTRQRRLYTDEFKRQVVAESFDPEISVAEIARRYEMNANALFNWWCQTKTDRSQRTGLDPISSRKLTPFGQGLSTVFLKFFTAVEMAFEVEVVVNGGLDGGELLKTSHRPEPRHGFFSPPQGLM